MTLSDRVRPETALDAERIIRAYGDLLGIEVRHYFRGAGQLTIYRCQDTGYRFFHPPSLAGDETLYQQLQRFDWYYAPWKWEHEAAVRHLKRGNRLLDVGCGAGGFLVRVQERGLTAEGLEVNPSAANAARSAGVTVHTVPLDEFSARNTHAFDAVCAFQVLEHIYDVHAFMTAAVRALRPGGRLILGVPNNNPFLYRHDVYTPLNLPPHHMGLWDAASLRRIAPTFGLTVETVRVEPLRAVESHHFFDLLLEARCGRWLTHRDTRERLAGVLSFIHRTTRFPLEGRNLLAVYRKSDIPAS